MAYLVRKGTRGDSDLRDKDENLEVLINSKGLLEINPDRTIHHAKQAYGAVQHITAIFDNTITRIADFDATLTGGGEKSKYALFGYQSKKGGLLVTIWRSSDTPGKRPEMETLELKIAKGGFEDPVWVDLVSGNVYDIGDSLWKAEGYGSVFPALPVYDAVIVVAERAVLGDLLPSD